MLTPDDRLESREKPIGRWIPNPVDIRHIQPKGRATGKDVGMVKGQKPQFARQTIFPAEKDIVQVLPEAWGRPIPVAVQSPLVEKNKLGNIFHIADSLQIGGLAAPLKTLLFPRAPGTPRLRRLPGAKMNFGHAIIGENMPIKNV
jgi:hypothetical protein